MKNFIVSILCAAVFFVGMGALVEKAGARFKSDEKALELIRRARVAIGGDAAIAEVRSMTIVGRTTKTLKIEGTEQTIQGETEIAMQLPDRLMKTVRLGDAGDAAAGAEKRVEVIVMSKDAAETVGAEGGLRKVIVKGDRAPAEFTSENGQRVVVRTKDGTVSELTEKDGKFVDPNGKEVIMTRVAKGPDASVKQNELARTTLALLLSAPEGSDVAYTFAGEGSVDGVSADIVNAELPGGSVKIYLSRSTSLPLMISYSGEQMPQIIHFKRSQNAPADGERDNVIFTKKMDDAAAAAEFQLRFSDYRSVNGVQLPFRWTQTVNGAADEVFEVTNYEINPANIADKFKNTKVFVRKTKPQQ